MTYGNHYEFSNSQEALAYRLAPRQSRAFGTDQKTLPPNSDCAWSWYICCSTKFSCRENSFMVWLPYCKLVFEVFEHDRDFFSKQSSTLLVPLTACLPTWTRSGGQHLFYTTPEGDSHSSTQKACDQCSHFWYCCKQTLPLIEAWPSHSIWS